MDKIALLKSMIEKDSENCEAWYLLGEAYQEQGDIADCLAAYSNAIQTDDERLKESVMQAMAGLVRKQPVVDTDENYSEVDDEEEVQADKPTPLKVLKGTKLEERVTYISDRRVTFQDVGGLDQLKKTIEMKIIKPFQNPGLFKRFRKKAGGGILLYGPPGCGKTFIAKATAGEVGANFFPIHITDIIDPYFGASERNLHDIFMNARAHKPAVIFIDEFDALGYHRSKSTSDLMRPLVDTLLTEMESVDKDTSDILIIGATNMPWDVDPAFKRPGRFDRQVFVQPPDETARKAILEIKLIGKPIDNNIDVAKLAAKTEYFSGADLEHVIELASEKVLEEIMETDKERLIEETDLLQAIAEVNPSTLEWLSTIKNYVKYSNQSGIYNDVVNYLKKQ